MYSRVTHVQAMADACYIRNRFNFFGGERRTTLESPKGLLTTAEKQSLPVISFNNYAKADPSAWIAVAVISSFS